MDVITSLDRGLPPLRYQDGKALDMDLRIRFLARRPDTLINPGASSPVRHRKPYAGKFVTRDVKRDYLCKRGKLFLGTQPQNPLLCPCCLVQDRDRHDRIQVNT